jgi:hypothetical protein
MRTILFLMGTLAALGQPKFDAAVTRVQVSIGLQIIFTVATVKQTAFVFPRGDQPGEAWIARNTIYVPREKIAAMKSGRELAQFLAHAAAHDRLNPSVDFAEHERLMEILQLVSNHIPPEIIERSWAAWWKKHEEEAQALGEQIFAASDCARGKCKEFDDLLIEARQK